MQRSPLVKGATLTGAPFEYSGTLEEGVVVYFKGGTRKTIKPEIIQFVRQEITRRSPVAMGANRTPLVRDSLGESLRVQRAESPQVLSYLVPLLVDEGFCSVSKQGRNFMVRRK